MPKVNYQIQFCDVKDIELNTPENEQTIVIATMQVEREDIQSQLLSSTSDIIVDGDKYRLDTRFDAYTECTPATNTFTLCIPVKLQGMQVLTFE